MIRWVPEIVIWAQEPLLTLSPPCRSGSVGSREETRSKKSQSSGFSVLVELEDLLADHSARHETYVWSHDFSHSAGSLLACWESWSTRNCRLGGTTDDRRRPEGAGLSLCSSSSDTLCRFGNMMKRVISIENARCMVWVFNSFSCLAVYMRKLEMRESSDGWLHYSSLIQINFLGHRALECQAQELNQ